MLLRRLSILIAFVVCSVWAFGQVNNYPAPKGQDLSTDYSVEVNGKPVPVYPAKTQHHDKKYSLAYFDFSGTVTVTIKSNKPLDKLEILPYKYGFKPVVKGNQATFTANKPFDIAFEPTGQDSPLLLFSNDMEKDAPNPKDKNVVYFGPGVHNPKGGIIKLKSNQTLYIAGGAVVNAGIDASGDNIRIMGRGILDGSDWEHNAGPNDFMVNATDCNNLLMKDIIIKGSYYWTVVPQRCDQVMIDHIRLAGSRVGNDDGVDPCNSSNVTIKNCFFRTDDDAISPKGTTRAGGEVTSRAVDNILVENCTFWVDFANVFRIATESSCPAIRNFTARNIDVIHFPTRNNVQIFYLHPTGNMPMENLTFENIRINGASFFNLAKITPMQPLVGTRPIETPKPNNITIGSGRRGLGSRGYGEFVPIAGDGPYVHNVTFKNIYTYGKNKTHELDEAATLLKGISKFQNVSNIVFDNVNLYGKPLTKETSGVVVGDFSDNIIFTNTKDTSHKAFVHPGILHNTDDLERIKQIVATQKQPGIGSYLLLKALPTASANYAMKGPFEKIARDGVDGSTKSAFEQDFNAAYYNALMWSITGEEAHAQKAIAIINAYSNKLKAITGSNDNDLLAGLSAFPLANAAEIMRYSYTKWTPAEIAQCEQMLRNVFVKQLMHFFTKPAYTNGNWGAAAIKSMMALGIFLNDHALFDNAVTFFYNGVDNGALNNYIVTKEGQCQESGRDQQHTMLGIGCLAEACEVGFKQGLDMYSAFDNKLLKGFEYTASYNLGNTVPYVQWKDITGKYSQWTIISTMGRGAFRPVFELAYNAYAIRKKIPMPYTKQVLEKARPEGPAPYNDNAGLGTLLFYSGN